MVAFSPDSSDDESLNLIQAKLRKRVRNAPPEEEEEQDSDGDASSRSHLESLDEENDKENSKSDVIIKENVSPQGKVNESKDLWDTDDDSIPDEALEAAMLAAQAAQANWRAQEILQAKLPAIQNEMPTARMDESNTSKIRGRSLLPSDPPSTTRPTNDNQNNSPTSSVNSTSNSSSSIDDSSSNEDVFPIPPQITLVGAPPTVSQPRSRQFGNDPKSDTNNSTKLVFQDSKTQAKAAFEVSKNQASPFSSGQSSQDEIPYRDESLKPTTQSQLETNYQDLSNKRNVSPTTRTRASSIAVHAEKVQECSVPVPQDVAPTADPFCVCEYASDDDDEWSFSELENKERTSQIPSHDELDAFGFPIDPQNHFSTLEKHQNIVHGPNETPVGITDQKEESPVASNHQYHSTVEQFSRPAAAAIEQTERTLEIDPSLYEPKPPSLLEPPIVHEFNLRTRPLNRRSTISVHQVFQSPITRLWYSKFDSFNQMQSEMSNMLANSDDNVVVSAPTGAGTRFSPILMIVPLLTLVIQERQRCSKWPWLDSLRQT